VLVATDVAARGVDVKDIGLVVNYDLPNEPEAYVHRIGRTARAGADGRAVSFCSEEELEFLREIEKVIKQPIPRWDDHAYHIEALAEHHARWKPGGRSGPKPSNGGNRGGGGGGRSFRGRR
jgi:ATP-dependent RNA helicase RhlE